jgi:hypothetical protein
VPTRLLTALLLTLVAAGMARALGPGRHRQIVAAGNSIVCYQPQADNWRTFVQLHACRAVSFTPAGGSQVIRVLKIRASTSADSENQLVPLDNYAGHDGNAHKNSGSGWQKSDGSGGWSSVNSSANSQAREQHYQQHDSSYDRGGDGMFGTNNDWQDRQRRSFRDQNFQGFQRPGGWSRGGSFGGFRG